MKKNFCFFIFFFFISFVHLRADGVKERHTKSIEGVYKISAIEKKDSYSVVHFQKIPFRNESKSLYIELETYDRNLFFKGAQVDIIADVREDSKGSWEAEQMFLSLHRSHGRISVGVASRKTKVVNFEKTSYLKMNVPDYWVF